MSRSRSLFLSYVHYSIRGVVEQLDLLQGRGERKFVVMTLGSSNIAPLCFSSPLVCRRKSKLILDHPTK